MVGTPPGPGQGDRALCQFHRGHLVETELANIQGDACHALVSRVALATPGSLTPAVSGPRLLCPASLSHGHHAKFFVKQNPLASEGCAFLCDSITATCSAVQVSFCPQDLADHRKGNKSREAAFPFLYLGLDNI